MKEVSSLGGQEGSFLLDVLRAFVRGDAAPSVPEELNWSRLERMAGASRLMPLLLSMVDDRQVHPGVLSRWKSLQVGIELHHLRARRAAVDLCCALETAQIPCALTRGMALAEWIYGNPTLRPMVDVDVLVPEAARHHVMHALASGRFGTPKRLRSQFAYQVDGVVFEIHWCFLTPKRYRDVANWDHWLDRRVKLAADTNLYRLEATDELIALLLHAFLHHQLDNLQQWLDIALVSRVDSVDWDYFAGWVKDAGVGRMVWSALGMVDALLNLNLRERCPELRNGVGAVHGDLLLAYVAPLLGRDSVGSFLDRRRHLLWVAPDVRRKVAQCLRFLSVDELVGLARVAGLRFNARSMARDESH